MYVCMYIYIYIYVWLQVTMLGSSQEPTGSTAWATLTVETEHFAFWDGRMCYYSVILFLLGRYIMYCFSRSLSLYIYIYIYIYVYLYIYIYMWYTFYIKRAFTNLDGWDGRRTFDIIIISYYQLLLSFVLLLLLLLVVVVVVIISTSGLPTAVATLRSEIRNIIVYIYIYTHTCIYDVTTCFDLGNLPVRACNARWEASANREYIYIYIYICICIYVYIYIYM